MADDLGTAELRIVVNDEQARRSIDELRQYVNQASQDITRRTRRATSQAAGGGGGGGGDLPLTIDRQSVRRFNLRGLNAALESIAEDIDSIRTARGVNIGASWTKALEVLAEVDEDLRRLQAGQKLNLNANWTAALQTLQEVDEDLRKLQAGQTLNLNASWTAALQTLQEVDEDLRRLQAGQQLNLNASWTAALQTLQEIDEDLRRLTGAQRLNLSSNWTAALRLLSEIDEDLRLIRAGERLNLNSSWTSALNQLTEIDNDLQFIGASRTLNIRASWSKALEQLEDIREDIARAAADEGRRIGRLNVSPIRGGAAFPGSPDFLRGALPPLPSDYFSGQRRRLDAAARRRNDIASNALIGGAFPLLFGQGIGASLGGGLGGAGGGAIGGQFGFGLSLLGTAVGAQFDAIIQKSTVLGNALSNPIARFGELQQAGILSSKGLERQVESLINVGREAEAAALVQQDLAASYGGVEAAKRLADEQDRLNRSWTEFSVNLGQFALTPIADAATDAASALRGLNEVLRLLARIPVPGRGPSGGGGILGGAGRVVGNILNPATGVLGGLGAAARFLFPPRTPSAGDGTTPQTAESEAKRAALLNSQYKLITAQVQGYKDLALRAERQVSLEQEALDIANLRARRAGQPEIDARRTQGDQERYRIDEQLLNLERDRARIAQDAERKAVQEAAQRASTLRLISSETEIQAGAIERQLQNAQALAQVEAGILRDALAQRQAIEESTASAVERERALRAELGEAQALGDETAIFRATTQLYLAAGQTKLALIDGARALSDAGTSLRDNILNAQRSIRSTLEGSFDLLRAPIQQQLLEQARGRINFSLFDVGRVRTPSEIFGAAAASESIAAQQQIIAQSSTALVDVNYASALVSVMQELNNKKWDVAVNVQGASGYRIIGDVVNATS